MESFTVGQMPSRKCQPAPGSWVAVAALLGDMMQVMLLMVGRLFRLRAMKSSRTASVRSE